MPILETETDPHYPSDMIERVARLEQIAANTSAAIVDLRSELRALRSEMVGGNQSLRTEMVAEFRSMRAETAAEFRAIRSDMRTQFYWLLGAFGAMFAIMAHGFHWL